MADTPGRNRGSTGVRREGFGGSCRQTDWRCASGANARSMKRRVAAVRVRESRPVRPALPHAYAAARTPSIASER